jgi:hypothetical protein
MSTIPAWLEVDAGHLAPLDNTPITPPSLESAGSINAPFGAGGLPAQNGPETQFLGGVDLASVSGITGAVGTVSSIR